MNEEKMEFINGNQFAIGSDGWALLAPFGDTAYPLSAGGKNEVVIQRITKENATEMVNAFKSVTGKVVRWIKGSPIFLGHPDDPQTGHKYPVKDQVGMFADLEVRENGLYVRPMFNDKGAEILDKPEKYYFSGRWPVKQTGHRGDMRVYEPVNITSIGMTRNPNLPTELLNEKPKPEPNIMEKTKLIALLATAGITLSNEATDEQIEASLKGFGASKKDAETTLVNERASITALKAEIETLKSENAKARNAEITSLINERITSGAITEAEKALWTKRLETNFVNEAPALQALASKLKTQQNPSVSGNRARNPVSQPEAGLKLVSFANEKRDAILKSNPTLAVAEAFRLGYAEAEKEHPDLVEQLNTNKS